MDRTLAIYRWFLIIWGAASLLFFANVNFLAGKDVDGSKFGGMLDLLHPYYYGLLYSTVCIIPAVLCMPAISRTFGGLHSAVGRAVAFLSISGVSFGIGNGFWFYYNTCSHWGSLACGASIEVPYPSWADAGYLGLLPLAAVALVSLTRVLDLRLRDLVWVVLIAAVIAVPTIYMTWSIGGHGKEWLFDPESPGFLSALKQMVTGGLHVDEASNLISGIYVLSDTVLFSLAVVLLVYARRMSGGLFFMPLVAVALAFVFQYAGDMLFFKRVFDETFYNADISDFAYGSAAFTISFAVYLFGRAYQKLMLQMSATDTGEAPKTTVEGVA